MADSPWVAIGISGLSLALAAVFVAFVGRAAPPRPAPARRRLVLVVAALTAAWMALSGAVAASGYLAEFERRPPPFFFLVVACLSLALALGLSRVGAWLSTLPLAWLVGWQAFRLPLELTMHRAATEGIMPSVMSYSGYNFDIVTGCTALALGFWLTRGRVPRAVVVLWNALGITLLVVVLAIAIASSPLFKAFGDDQLNTWVAHFPYVWLPSVLVVSAALGHVVIARRLLADQRAARAQRGPGLIEARP